MNALSSLFYRKDIIENINRISDKFLVELESIYSSKDIFRRYPFVDETELPERLTKVVAKVNEFVDFHPQIMPQIGYIKSVSGSGYSSRQKKLMIGMSDMAEECIESIIAHEYCHHLQMIKSYTAFQWNIFEALVEGFALGVELQMARILSKEKNDTNYLRRNVKDIDYYLNVVLFHAKSGMPMKDEEEWCYHYGAAAFLLAEKMYGTGIYKEIIHSDKPYDLLVEMLSEHKQRKDWNKVTILGGKQ